MRPETEAAAKAVSDHMIDLISEVIRKKVGQAFEEMELAINISRSRSPLRKTMNALIFAAETSGGVAGRDEGLCEAIAKARLALDEIDEGILERNSGIAADAAGQTDHRHTPDQERPE